MESSTKSTLEFTKESAESKQGELLTSYPVPDTLDAIHIRDGTRYEKDHFAISENYKVTRFIDKTGIGLRGLCLDP